MEENNTITIEHNGEVRHITPPQTWNDLPLRDIMLVYSTLFQVPGTGMLLQRFTTMKIVSITKYLLGVDNAFMEAWQSERITDDPEGGEMVFAEEVRAVIHATIGGLFDIEEEDGNVYYSPKLNLTKSPYPEIVLNERRKDGRSNVTWFYGPSDGLGNITIYELGLSFTLFEQYVATGEDKWVDELIAVLYRPSRPRTKHDADTAWGGDRRVKLRGYEAKAEERAEVMKTMNVMVKRVILFWFASCRQTIINRYPAVFNRRSKTPSKPNEYGWAGVLLSLAGGPAQLDAVSDQHYSNALTWLDMQGAE